ncbi:MAG: LptF/LptG family permease [Pyrinomonadaceae bacterium]
MPRLGRIIPGYIIRAILPYFAASWLLLTVVLFVQQASRFSDIFFSVNIPSRLIWQLSLAIIPSVISFTCPMAVLVGTIIGLSKMKGDSELTAVRASGIGNLQILLPVVVLGVLLSLFAFAVNLLGVPAAAAIVRKVAIQAAIKKLESPIEPGVFNTEVAGYTIFVRGGDPETGRWNNILVFAQEPAGEAMRLITAGQGRVDVSGDATELVLFDAESFSIPNDRSGKVVAESIDGVRFAIKTRRSDLVQKLSSGEQAPEELGLSQLSELASTKQGKERTEAEIVWNRRILLSVTPLLFCLLGASMVLRVGGGGRGRGVVLALVGLIGFYLTAFLGEQLARTGVVSVPVGSLFPVILSLGAISFFLFADKARYRMSPLEDVINSFRRVKVRPKLQFRSWLVDVTTGLRDLDVLTDLVRYFALAFGFLAVIFLVFTAFELWKFAGNMEGGVRLLTWYLIFLLPFVYIQLAPSCTLIAVLATYVIKSRQNEVVTWSAAGQSVYRLLIPCFALALILGLFNWQVQERLLPFSNQIQENLRNQIRNYGAVKAGPLYTWFATRDRIYAFKAQPGDSATDASDNEIAGHSLIVFEFDERGKAQRLYRYPSAEWTGSGIRLTGSGETVELRDRAFERRREDEIVIAEDVNPFAAVRRKPGQMNSRSLRELISASGSEVERQILGVALQRKYSTLFVPFVIALFSAPFSLNLSRRGKALTVGAAVGLWLAFTAVVSVFEQIGTSGALAPELAIWGPLMFFSMLGVYLLSRVRT